MPFYMAYDKEKPCMSLNFKIEDLRYYMYTKNFIRQCIKRLVFLASEILDTKSDNYDFKDFLTEILRIRKYIESVFLKNSFLTQLEHKRADHLIIELNDLIKLTQSFHTDQKSDSTFRKFDFNRIIESISRINTYLIEPLNIFPDINLWLLSNNEPIGICTIKSNDIIWSKNVYERGIICNQLIYTDIKSLNPKDFEKPVNENIARLRLYMWLGVEDEAESIFSQLPDGYGLHETFFNHINLPTRVFYNEKSSFEFIAHIYQGRDLLGMDSTGLSDPYVKITLGNQSVYSSVITQTNNPNWNTSLFIPEIYLYSSFDSIRKNPPEIMLEIYDQDLVGVCIKKVFV